MKKHLSIIIPAYNEEKEIKNTIETIIYIMSGWKIQILVVDDGSTDNTKFEVMNMAIKHSGIVQLLSYEKNKGKGYAVHQGLLYSTYRQKLILDADLSCSPTPFLKFFAENKKSTNNFILKGQRVQKIKQPLYRIFLGKVWKVLVWVRTGMYLDSQCPFTFLNVPKHFYDTLNIDGFAFDVELLYKAKKKGYWLLKIDVPYFNSVETKVTPKKTYEMFKDLLRINH